MNDVFDLVSIRLTTGIAMYLVCFGVLVLFCIWLRSRVEEPLLKRGLVVGRNVSILGFFLGLLEWLTDLPFGVAFDSLRQALNTSLATISGVPITPVTLLTVCGILAASWWGSAWVRRRLEATLLERNIGDPGTVAAVSRLAQYVLIALGTTMGLQNLGIDLGAVFTAGAVFAVGIGFAMQKLAENFISGVILLVERTIRPGDILELDGRMVRVLRLGIRSTLVRSQDDAEIIVPNTLLVQSQVQNLKLSDGLCRVRVPIGVAYGTDPEHVQQILAEAAAGVSQSPARSPVVLFQGFGDSALNFEVSIWTDNPWLRPNLRSELAIAMHSALSRAEVTIPFPQMDVHMHVL